MALFERYGEWPDEPLAQPDPNAPAARQDATRVIVQRTSNSTFDGTSIVVLDAVDPLELERAEVFG